jgi:hypothetical protein
MDRKKTKRDDNKSHDRSIRNPLRLANKNTEKKGNKKIRCERPKRAYHPPVQGYLSRFLWFYQE